MSKKQLSEIEAALRNQIAVLTSQDPAQIKSDTVLSQLGLDSMGFVELLVFIEKSFGLKLLESGLKKEDFSTLAALSRRIHETLLP